jgi:hypothetical protein
MLTNMAKQGQQFAMISCPTCHESAPINPVTLLPPSNQPVEHLPCPLCKDGFVVFVEVLADSFWGCGTCGNVWQSKELIKMT